MTASTVDTWMTLLENNDRADNPGIVTMGVRLIAEGSGRSQTAVGRAIADLERRGLIVRLSDGPYGRRRWRMVLEDEPENARLKPETRRGKHARSASGRFVSAHSVEHLDDHSVEHFGGLVDHSVEHDRDDAPGRTGGVPSRELRDAARSVLASLRADRRRGDGEGSSSTVPEAASLPSEEGWSPDALAEAEVPTAMEARQREESEANIHLPIGGADRAASRSSQELEALGRATREQRRALRDLSWRLEGGPHELLSAAALQSLTFDEASGLISEYRDEVYYREGAWIEHAAGAEFSCRLSDVSPAEQERARRRGIEAMFIPESEWTS